VAKPGPVTKLDQFMDYMRDHSTVEIVDLRAVLAKQTRRTYHLTDSHWNGYGAFVACNEVIERLSRQVPGLRPIPLTSFDLETGDGPAGNLAWMLTGNLDIAEHEVPSLQPRPPLPVLRVVSKKGTFGTVENPTQTGKVIIFGDSFADGLLPFLGYHFNQVSVYRLYNDHADGTSEGLAHIWNPAVIQQEKPEVVIDEILNSLLYIENPASIQRQDNLH
jgi:alginate O-acetyltransferase complex protein AlgJ